MMVRGRCLSMVDSALGLILRHAMLLRDRKLIT